MARIQLIHWNSEEAKPAIERLRRSGHDVVYELPSGLEFLKRLAQTLPEAVVIDLTRLPSQGRDFGILIRKSKSTRYLPLLFVDGEQQKVERIRKLLPDAEYTSWDAIDIALASALSTPNQNPVTPDSIMDSYAGRPLWKKLGIKAGLRVALISGPADFQNQLGELPDKVTVVDGLQAPVDLAVWFVHNREEMQQSVERMRSIAAQCPLWIAWPKKSSAIKTDLSQQIVRDIGLTAGMVDYKICSIDATWSGLLFTKRKEKR